jgi:hypothetical protein
VTALEGTPLAAGAKATATFKAVAGQPTFSVTGNGFASQKNKTLTVKVVRGKTSFLLTRVAVDNAGNLARTLRIPATTLKTGDTLQLVNGVQVVATGLTKTAKK